METMMINVEEELQDCIAQLDVLQKKSLLEMIRSFVKKDDVDMKPQTIEEYNRELEEAVARVEAGEFYTHEEVTEMAKNW